MNSSTHTIGIVGVRDYRGVLYKNVSYIRGTLERHITVNGLTKRNIDIVTGGGKGVEQMIVRWCEENDIPYHTIPPNIERHGAKKAFSMRNNHIVHGCQELVMFWDGCIDTVLEALTTAAHQSKKSTVYPLV